MMNDELSASGKQGSIHHSSFIIHHSPAHPSHYWTQRLMAAGFSLEECAAIRGLTREVVFEHAKLAAEETDSVP